MNSVNYMRMQRNNTILCEEGCCFKQLGQNQLGLPYGTPCLISETELQLWEIIEALSGAPFDVKFISFDDILKDKDILKDIDVIINVGDGHSTHRRGSLGECSYFRSHS